MARVGFPAAQPSDPGGNRSSATARLSYPRAVSRSCWRVIAVTAVLATRAKACGLSPIILQPHLPGVGHYGALKQKVPARLVAGRREPRVRPSFDLIGQPLKPDCQQ